MEWQEPDEVKTLSRRERADLDIVNKWHSIKDDPGSRPFGFSHGFLVLRSRSSTVLGTFLFYALIWLTDIAIVSLVKGPSLRRNLHFLHVYFSQYEVQFLFFFAGSMALNVAFSLFEISSRKRWIYGFASAILLLIVPMLFFHWPFLGG